MGKLPHLSAVELAKILKKIGFIFIRQDGSHMFFKHSDGRATTVPNHPKDKIGPGLLLKIIKEDIKISREEFENVFSSIYALTNIPKGYRLGKKGILLKK